MPRLYIPVGLSVLVAVKAPHTALPLKGFLALEECS